MKIRALTLGQNLKLDQNGLSTLKNNLHHIAKLKEQFETQGIEVEYVRLASPPFSQETQLTKENIYSSPQKILEILRELNQLVKDNLLGIYSFCPGLCDQQENLTEEQHHLLNLIPDLLKTNSNMFSSVQVASTENGFNFEAIQKSAQIIQSLASPDPFQNVQFAVTANVPPNTPFFPSAYYQGTQPTVSIALEAADELSNVLDSQNALNHPLKNVQQAIRTRFEQIYDDISVVALPFCEKYQFHFEGIDFSPAPYPTQAKSIGTALEKFGLSRFGDPGGVFSVGFLTQAIQSVNRPQIGFSGFMQPLLEDFTIARRTNEGLVDLSKLLLYSTMCGLGLDCVPIPGDATTTEIQTLLMDLSMLSVRLDKPLTARLMPIPDKTAGQKTTFDFEYFTNADILELKSQKNPDLSRFLQFNPSYRFFD